MAQINFVILALLLQLQSSIVLGNQVETMSYMQTLDHFNHTFQDPMTFTQWYYVDRSFWSGAEDWGPILVYFGGEFALDNRYIGSCGVITESAPLLGALILYIEHRFYGQSVPYGSIDTAMNNPYVRGCLTTSQALEDFYKIISEVKKNLGAENSPVIVMGGSYAGILAALFRVRYPTIAMGALASSAPMFFDTFHSKEFYSVISNDFQEVSHDCYDKIKQSWKMIDDTAKQPNGPQYLSRIFGSCDPKATVEELKSYLVTFYTIKAQYNSPSSEDITTFCDTLVDPSNKNVLEGIARAINATYSDVPLCFAFGSFAVQASLLGENSTKAWNWQLCNELMIPFHSEHETMFPILSFNFSSYLEGCEAVYGVALHPWFTDDKKKDLNIILHGNTSNIIFTNGLRDPYNSVSVLEDISKTILAISTEKGSHCLELEETEPDDPIWLLRERRKIRRIFVEWLDKFYNPNSSSLLWKPRLWIVQIILLWFLQCLYIY